MISVRPEKTDDYTAIDQVNDVAFGQLDEGLLVRALRNESGFDPNLSLVAEDNGRIVGHILFGPVRIEGEGAGFDALALAPMSVLPEFQNRGIGSRLVRDGLDACRGADHPMVVVLGHVKYYPRFGFTPAGVRGIVAPFEVQAEGWMVLELHAGALRGVSGTVRYPAPFSQL